MRIACKLNYKCTFRREDPISEPCQEIAFKIGALFLFFVGMGGTRLGPCPFRLLQSTRNEILCMQYKASRRPLQAPSTSHCKQRQQSWPPLGYVTHPSFTSICREHAHTLQTNNIQSWDGADDGLYWACGCFLVCAHIIRINFAVLVIGKVPDCLYRARSCTFLWVSVVWL